MYYLDETPEFRMKMKKLAKKDRAMYDRIKRKTKEIISNPAAYKKLSNKMAGLRRVHIGHFVLIFYTDEANKIVKMLEYEHHDYAYRK